MRKITSSNQTLRAAKRSRPRGKEFQHPGSSNSLESWHAALRFKPIAQTSLDMHYVALCFAVTMVTVRLFVCRIKSCAKRELAKQRETGGVEIDLSPDMSKASAFIQSTLTFRDSRYHCQSSQSSQHLPCRLKDLHLHEKLTLKLRVL